MTAPALQDDDERDVCPNEWKVRGYARSSHSMLHPAMHECGRGRDHRGRCKCRFCPGTKANPFEATS